MSETTPKAAGTAAIVGMLDVEPNQSSHEELDQLNPGLVHVEVLLNESFLAHSAVNKSVYPSTSSRSNHNDDLLLLV